MTEFKIDDIEIVCVLVQINGNCHQVLTTAENKKIALLMIASADNGLKLSEELQPVSIQNKSINKGKEGATS